MDISPLAKKLRIKKNFATAILSAPPDYLKLLEPLPAGVRVDEELKQKYDFIQSFVAQIAIDPVWSAMWFKPLK